MTFKRKEASLPAPITMTAGEGASKTDFFYRLVGQRYRSHIFACPDKGARAGRL